MKKSSFTTATILKMLKSILRVLAGSKVELIPRKSEEVSAGNTNITEIKKAIKKEPKIANPEGLKNVLMVFDITLEISDIKNKRIISVPGLTIGRDSNGWFITVEGKETKIYDSRLESLGYYIKSDMHNGNVIFMSQLPILS